MQFLVCQLHSATSELYPSVLSLRLEKSTCRASWSGGACPGLRYLLSISCSTFTWLRTSSTALTLLDTFSDFSCSFGRENGSEEAAGTGVGRGSARGRAQASHEMDGGSACSTVRKVLQAQDSWGRQCSRGPGEPLLCTTSLNSLKNRFPNWMSAQYLPLGQNWCL